MTELITQPRPAALFNHITPSTAKRVATETFKAETREMSDYLRISNRKPHTKLLEILNLKLVNAIKNAQFGKENARITTGELSASFKAQASYWKTTAKLLKDYLRPHI